jgi:ribulose kinase
LSGMATGLSLTTDVDDLALSYLATVQSLAYGTRHIIEALVARGHQIATIVMTGSGLNNPVLVAEHADATGLPVVLPAEADSVLLGAAVLASVASGHQPSLGAAMRSMARARAVVDPRPELAGYHDAKYAVYRRMHDDQLAYRAIMDDADGR